MPDSSAEVPKLNPEQLTKLDPTPSVSSKLHESSESDIVSVKQNAWEAKRNELEQITDGRGLEIDEGIKDSVVAFNMVGLNTTQSCEGHMASENWGLQTPWIDIAAPNKPDTQFVGEIETFQRLADKFGIPLEEFRSGADMEGYFEAQKESAKNGETPEFVAWRTETDRMSEKLEEFLHDFYKDRQVGQHQRLVADKFGSGETRIMAGGGFDMQWNLPGTEKASDETVLARKAEMAAFTDFLKDKYFSGE
jgi:hypothetical protein